MTSGPANDAAIGIVANEFFDRAIGRTGGFGWVAREAAHSLRADAYEPFFCTGELLAPDGATATDSAGVPLVWAAAVARRAGSRGARASEPLAFLSIDYRPNDDVVLDAALEVPIIPWVQDSRPPSDVAKVNSPRIPGPGAVQPKGIEAIDCHPLARLAERARQAGRAMRFASPSPGLLAKVPDTFALVLPELEFLPYSGGSSLSAGPRSGTSSITRRFANTSTRTTAAWPRANG